MDTPERTLDEIRDLLGDLPQRLGAVLRGHGGAQGGGSLDPDQDETDEPQRRRPRTQWGKVKNLSGALSGLPGVGSGFAQIHRGMQTVDNISRALKDLFHTPEPRKRPDPAALTPPVATPAAQAVHKVWIDGPLPLPVTIHGGIPKGGTTPPDQLPAPQPLLPAPPTPGGYKALPPPTALNAPPPKASTVTTLAGSPLALGASPAMPPWLQGRLQPAGQTSAAPGTTRISAPSLSGTPPNMPQGLALAQLRLPPPSLPQGKVDFFHGPQPMPERLRSAYPPSSAQGFSGIGGRAGADSQAGGQGVTLIVDVLATMKEMVRGMADLTKALAEVDMDRTDSAERSTDNRTSMWDSWDKKNSGNRGGPIARPAAGPVRPPKGDSSFGDKVKTAIDIGKVALSIFGV